MFSCLLLVSVWEFVYLLAWKLIDVAYLKSNTLRKICQNMGIL